MKWARSAVVARPLCKRKVPGSIPGVSMYFNCCFSCYCCILKQIIVKYSDCVAQWIAHLTSNQGVVGSSPTAVDFFFVLFFGFLLILFLKKRMEKMGIDPITSCMLSRRSTI
jgi:hypothetical protein